MLVSQRNIPLIQQQASTVPLITVENYDKWYNLYMISPFGEVLVVPSSVLDEASHECKTRGALFGDHVWHPNLVLQVAKKFDGGVPPTSLEVITGRWILHLESLSDLQAGDFGYYLDEGD